MKKSKDDIKKRIIEILKSGKILRFENMIKAVQDKYKIEKQSDKTSIKNTVKNILAKEALDLADPKNLNTEPLIYKLKSKELLNYPEIKGIILSTGEKTADNAVFYFLPNILNDLQIANEYAEELLKWFRNINTYYNTLADDKIKNYSEEKIMQCVNKDKDLEIQKFKIFVFNLWSKTYTSYLSIEKIKEIIENVILSIPSSVTDYDNTDIKVRELLYQIDQGITMSSLTSIIYTAISVKHLTKSDMVMKYYFYALMTYSKNKIEVLLNTVEYKDLTIDGSYNHLKDMLEYTLKSYIVLIKAESKKSDLQKFYNFIVALFEEDKLIAYEQGFLIKLIFSNENRSILSYILIMKGKDILQKYDTYITTDKNKANFFQYLLNFEPLTKLNINQDTNIHY